MALCNVMMLSQEMYPLQIGAAVVRALGVVSRGCRMSNLEQPATAPSAPIPLGDDALQPALLGRHAQIR